jgi:hypothetical protein
MWQIYQCWWRIFREISFFFEFRISHVLHFYICDLLTDSPSYVYFFCCIHFHLQF